MDSTNDMDENDDEDCGLVFGCASDEDWMEEDCAAEAQRLVQMVHRSADQEIAAVCKSANEQDLQEHLCEVVDVEIDNDPSGEEIVIEAARPLEECIIDYVCALLDDGINTAACATSKVASGDALATAPAKEVANTRVLNRSPEAMARTCESAVLPAKPTAERGASRPLPRGVLAVTAIAREEETSETKKESAKLPTKSAESPLMVAPIEGFTAVPLVQSPLPLTTLPDAHPWPTSTASSSPLRPSKSKRRIIGGVVRAPGPAESGSVFQMDRDDDSDTAKSASQPKVRSSSLPKAYDALGAAFYHLDAPTSDHCLGGNRSFVSPSGSLKKGNLAKGSYAFDFTGDRANAQPLLRLGTEKLGKIDLRLRSPSWAASKGSRVKQLHGLATSVVDNSGFDRQLYGALSGEASQHASVAPRSALAMDLGLCQPPSSGTSSFATLPPASPLLARSVSLGTLRVTKKEQAAGIMVSPPSSSGSFAWTMHTAQAAAKRGRPPLTVVL
jgi:hypothetical protein